MSHAAAMNSSAAQPDKMPIVFMRGTSSGDIIRMTGLTRWKAARSCAQHPAGAFAHLGHDLGAERVDLLVGHGLVARLDCHRDGDRLLAGLDALALVDVEYADA